MPTTLGQIVFFALLVLPGIPYLEVRRRQRSNLERSAFRETVNVVVVGLIADTVVLFAAWLVATIWPAVGIDVSALLTDASVYLANHYVRIGLWLVVVLAVAAVASWGAGHLVNKKLSTHPANMSSWELVFNFWRDDQPTLVGCELDNGGWVQGQLASSNIDATDIADRDLVLAQPLHAIEPGKTQLQPIDGSVLVVSARNIRTLTVTYLAKDPAALATGEDAKRRSPESASGAAATPTLPEQPSPDAALVRKRRPPSRR